MVGAPAERAALQVERAPLGRADDAPAAPRRVSGLAKNDIVEAKIRGGKCRIVICDKTDRDILR